MRFAEVRQPICLADHSQDLRWGRDFASLRYTEVLYLSRLLKIVFGDSIAEPVDFAFQRNERL